MFTKTHQFINLEPYRNKIFTMLGPYICGVFKKHKAYIAGGSINCVFTNRKINDWDIFFPDSKSFIECKNELISNFPTSNGIAPNMSNMLNVFTQASVIPNGDGNDVDVKWSVELETQSAISIRCQKKVKSKMKDITDIDAQQMSYGEYYKDSDNLFQLVNIMFGSPDEVLNTFDFTCCMAAYDFSVDDFSFHPQFIPDCLSKKLRYNADGNKNPFGTLLRVDKYKSYGYEMEISEYFKIMLHIQSLKINTNRDFFGFIKHMPLSPTTMIWRKEILGYDTLKMEQIEDRLNKPFNPFFFIDALNASNLTEVQIKYDL